MLGTLSDFEDGTLQGWGGGAGPMNIAGDPSHGGLQSRVLSVGNGGTWATHNTSGSYSGPVDPAVLAIELDVCRSSAETDSLELRLVLIGPGTSNRWTSAVPAVIPNDSAFSTYRFSLLEEDLVQVQGTASYADLLSDVDRVMFRHDPGPPSANGTALGGVALLDNIRTVPEPSAAILACSIGLVLLARRRAAGASLL